MNREETERLYMRNGQVYKVTDEAAEGSKSVSSMNKKEGLVEHFLVWLGGWY